jgi:IS6 family transposase
VRVAGRWTYLYRAVDSTGATIDFFLSETRDVFAAGAFFRKALAAPGHPRPRVINVDGNPSYPRVVDELKRTHALGQRCRCRVVPYLNNIVEQDHRAIKRRIQASLGFRSFAGRAGELNLGVTVSCIFARRLVALTKPGTVRMPGPTAQSRDWSSSLA